MESLRKQLKTINLDIRPDKAWKKETRQFLLSEIKNETRDNKVHLSWIDRFNSLRMIRLAWQPVGAMAIIIALFLGGSGVLVAEAQKANPGDNLFVVKRVIEKTTALTKTNAINRTIFAGRLLDNRVDELKRIAEKESKLVSADGNENTKSIVLAVAEIGKQVEDVGQNFQKMNGEQLESEKKLAVTALNLNKKIRGYYRDLQAVNKKMKDDKAVHKEIDKTLAKVEGVSSKVLKVIIDKHEKGALEINKKEIEDSLALRVEQVKVKATGVTNKLNESKNDEVAEGVKKVNLKIAAAETALEEDKYSLSLTLADDSNKILEMLYGNVFQGAKVETKSSNEENKDNKNDTVTRDEGEQKVEDKTGGDSADVVNKVGDVSNVDLKNTSVKSVKITPVAVKEKTVEVVEDKISSEEKQMAEFEVGIK